MARHDIAVLEVDIAVDQLADRMAELEEEDDEGESGYLKEFNKLKTDQKMFDDLDKFSNSAKLDANKDKNRSSIALPYDHNRVKLNKRTGDDGSDYINASYIDGHKAKEVYIVAQGPLENTVIDFWRMIWEKEVCQVVILTEDGVSEKYWPDSDTEDVTFGNFTVHLISEKSLPDYQVRELRVTYATASTSESRSVTHYQYTGWPMNGAPSASGVIDLIDQVTRQQQRNDNKPVVIHCGAGIGCTGVFCALAVAIERIKVEHLVNIFSIVKHLRTQRAHMVQTPEQYRFLYKAAFEYVDSMSDQQ